MTEHISKDGYIRIARLGSITGAFKAQTSKNKSTAFGSREIRTNMPWHLSCVEAINKYGGDISTLALPALLG